MAAPPDNNGNAADGGWLAPVSNRPLGVLGGGQLGMMFAEAAAGMGLAVESLSPEASPPVARASSRHHRADYADASAVEAFARGCSAVSYEFENVPASAAEACERGSVLRPSSKVLRVCQDRVEEKAFLRAAGFATPGFAGAGSRSELDAVLAAVGLPAVLKTARGGYDGRGQRVLRRAEDADYAWAELGGAPCIVEAWVRFDRELSVIVARSADGAVEALGPIHNVHRRHILDLSVYPAGLPDETASAARRLARGVAEALELVGVIAVELFHEPGGGLKVNELAPRPHNSGHFSIEGCATSQFAQQALATSGQSVRPFAPSPGKASAMVNLLGDLWAFGEPSWDAVEAEDGARLHLYGKAEARAGRKMGHLTVVDDTPAHAVERAVRLRRAAAPKAFALAEDRPPDEDEAG